MKKALLMTLGVLVGAGLVLGILQLASPEETPIVLAQVDISGGFRVADSEYVVARRFYSNGVVLEKTNTEEIAIYKELTSEGVATYQALLEAYTGPESLGARKTEEQCASWADGIDYSFTFPTQSEEKVSSCNYDVDLTNPLVSLLIE